MGRIQDRLAIVTGAAHGLGAAIAQRLAEEGARLALLDLDGAALERVAADLRARGRPVLAQAADVTEEDAVQAAFARIEAECGAPDILVNNVGGARNRRIWEMPAEDWDFTLRLNLRPTFLCTRAVLPGMMERQAGSIVCLSSGARNGTPWSAADSGAAAYSAAKAGIAGFVRAVALEVSHRNVRINAVAPGPIETERTRAAFARMEQTVELSPNRLVPMRRVGQPREVADAVLYLASDEASYVTGSILDVAGGR
ncbi:SDR family NAD(P)-dependent oxidoreductase [Paracraurococcus ruber]|uniref:SDR family oxidoreductase n=1 Tax=Paracraurococcus ruber TaxID=77675 RepID=A0ABS1D3E9_9PROT|nr:SDR family NAD(P)-dependent oxidoreductase [Paracraurococcus ruber]MBK1660409.1 SDR family oxidoreductase [Paracraurococcus ruber]TDG27564.1 SDR family oxidoreductase [Paracraurococcus ruber]